MTLAAVVSTQRCDQIQAESPKTPKAKTATMADVLGNEKEFESFMMHLAKEWSMEILLAYIELTHFQHSVYEAMGDIDRNEESLFFSEQQHALLRNGCITKSFVVYSDIKDVMKECTISNVDDVNDDSVSFKIRAYILFRKYIESGDLQINISHAQKHRVQNLMKPKEAFINEAKMSNMEMFSLYEDIINELFKYLCQSFYRFSRTQRSSIP